MKKVKVILLVMAVFMVMAVVSQLGLDKKDTKVGDKVDEIALKQEAPEQIKEKEVEQDISYIDPSMVWSIKMPASWQDKYVVETKSDEDADKAIFKYKAQDGTEQLIFIINTYTDKEIAEIYHMPNNKIFAMSGNQIFTTSQALDMPYMPDTEDFESYSRMINDLDNVLYTFEVFEKYAVIHEIMENKQDEKYLVKVMYPEMIGADKKVNEKIKEQIKELVNAFLANILDADDLIDIPEQAINSIYVFPEIRLFDDEYISIYYGVSEYFAGAAHPNNFSITFNYDLEKEKELELTDLFDIDEETLVEKIAELARTNLEKQFEEIGADTNNDMFESGVEAKIENFNNFNLGQDLVIINFDLYQVGPYALGGFFVEIPMEKLK